MSKLWYSSEQHLRWMSESLTRSRVQVLPPLKENSCIMTARLWCLQSTKAFDSCPPSLTRSNHHQILYLLNNPPPVCRRGMCELSGSKDRKHCSQFLPPFWKRQWRRRGAESYCLNKRCSLLLLSLARSFSFQNPSLPFTALWSAGVV